MTHVLGERLKELAEDDDREKALKDVANAIAKEKGKEAEVTEKVGPLPQLTSWQLAEGKLAETEDRLRGVELKFAEAASLNLAQADQIADLKVALEACKSKWYD